MLPLESSYRENPSNLTVVRKALTNITYLGPSQDRNIAPLFEESHFAQDSVLFRPGDLSTHLVVVKSGEVILTESSNARKLVMREGDYYGVSSLLVPRVHKYEGIVVADKGADLLHLEGATFRDFLQSLRTDNHFVTERYTSSYTIEPKPELSDEEKERRLGKAAVLAKIEIFKDITGQDREEIAGTMEDQRLQVDGVVYNDGDEGDALYIVQEGEIMAQLLLDGEWQTVQSYQAGDYFGEMALLSDKPRNGRTIVHSPEGASTLRLPKEAFERVLANNLTAMRSFVNIMSRRLAEQSKSEMN